MRAFTRACTCVCVLVVVVAIILQSAKKSPSAKDTIPADTVDNAGLKTVKDTHANARLGTAGAFVQRVSHAAPVIDLCF